MKILLFGKDGQVGWELQRALSPLGQLITLGRDQVDLADAEAIKMCIRQHQPNVIVNAAAYTAVDRAETEPNKAFLINEHAVKILAEEAARANAWFVHYSTDYVFDGEKSAPYIETDQPLPLGVYGQTKLAGEQAIRNSRCKHLILRTSWVYSIFGSNFPLTILQRAREREQIDVVSDSFGTPTSASLIADTTALMLYRVFWDALLATSASGTYHLVVSGKTSWYEYAKFLVETARAKGMPIKVASDKVLPVSADTYKTGAQRPKNSQLDNSKLCKQFGLVLPDWKIHVERLVNELIQSRAL